LTLRGHGHYSAGTTTLSHFSASLEGKLVNLITRLKSRKLGAVILAAGVLLMLVGILGSVAVADHVAPKVVLGNPTCEELVEGETGEFVLDASQFKENGFDDYGDASFSVSIDFTFSGGEAVSFDFKDADPPVLAVFVKTGAVTPGNPGGNLYEYDEPTTSDEGLVAPGGKGISHISFCYVVAGTTTTTERGTTTTTAGETTTTTAGETTTTTAAPTTTTTVLAVGGVQITPTTAAPAQVAGAQILPVTGPSSSWTLFLVGMSLILGGLILVFGERQYRPRRNQ
jgi:LPXTG-motif cell wall-anchored protein